MKQLVLLLFLTIFTGACFCQQPGNGIYKKHGMKKTMDKRTANGHLIITAEVIEMVRTDKRGEIISGSDLYVRRSAQDYFIKFSESAVTEKAIRNAMNKIKHPVKSLKMEAEIRNGLWDYCDGKDSIQSRTGFYIVIHKLITNQASE